jgi:hypothetical protein
MIEILYSHLTSNWPLIVGFSLAWIPIYGFYRIADKLIMSLKSRNEV